MNDNSKYLAAEADGISIPMLALGIVSVAAIVRALYNSKYGEKQLSKNELNAEFDQSKSLSYEVASLIDK